MANVMNSDLTEGHYTYSTSYTRTVRTTVTTTDENGIVNTQQSTVTTNSSNPPVSSTFTTLDTSAERRHQKIAWLICLVTLVTMVILTTVCFVLMFRVSFFWGMAIFAVGTFILPTICIFIRQKFAYRSRVGFRIGGFAIVDKSKRVCTHPPPPPQPRALSRTSIITNQDHTHVPPPVGTSNVNQNFGGNQFQTQTITMNSPYASTTQGYQTQTNIPGYETKQTNIWAQPAGYQGYPPQPSSSAYPPPPPGGQYADPPPSYENVIR
ncbi:hypothetical protein HOLleu_18561 [Holothuria leucospilota]|uniref:Uncharacterized protein n=1 Tax=Holothuria leucospilota TaxID=206669 RepID=A0A9Q1C2Z2_HOLLE|nr:hypothetical protein HOLleu_18561 [Holothuria leucospilota]